MNRMEKLKTEKDGLSILPDIYNYANGPIENVPESELFRMRWFGFFYRKKHNSFMVRVRISSGKLTSKQARVLAQLANNYGDDTVAITTRMGIQIRGISHHDLPTVLETLCDVGLETRQTGFDNIRNIMNCPVAGLQLDEAFDTSDIVTELSDRIIGNSAYSNLPRKFNISITGCHEDCGHSKISDIGLVPQVRHLENERKEGFRVQFGGAIGRFYATVSEDFGVWLPKNQAIAFILTVLDFYRDHGTRTDRKKARLLHLKEELGLDQIRYKINQLLAEPLELYPADPSIGKHHDHIGIFPQKQKGYRYAGLTIPTGRASANQWVELAQLSDTYGNSEIRLTAQQNVIIPFIEENRLIEFKQEKILNEFSYRPTPLLRGLVACTGKEGCDLAIVATKTPALHLIRELEERLEINRDELRIHWSGCPNSCAIVQTGDIGLHGTDLEVNGEYVDAVNIYYGGHIGPDAQIGTLIRSKVPVTELTDSLVEILTDQQYFTGIEKKENSKT